MSSEFPSCFGTERVRMMHGCWTPKVDTLVPSSGLCGSENWQFAPQFMAKKTDNTAKHRDFVWGSFFCIQTNTICEPSQIVGVPLAIDSWTIVFPFKSARNLLKMEKGWLLEGFSYNYSNVPSNVCWAKNTAWFKMSTELLDFKEFLISWGFNYPPTPIPVTTQVPRCLRFALIILVFAGWFSFQYLFTPIHIPVNSRKMVYWSTMSIE